MIPYFRRCVRSKVVGQRQESGDLAPKCWPKHLRIGSSTPARHGVSPQCPVRLHTSPDTTRPSPFGYGPDPVTLGFGRCPRPNLACSRPIVGRDRPKCQVYAALDHIWSGFTKLGLASAKLWLSWTTSWLGSTRPGLGSAMVRARSATFRLESTRLGLASATSRPRATTFWLGSTRLGFGQCQASLDDILLVVDRTWVGLDQTFVRLDRS